MSKVVLVEGIWGKKPTEGSKCSIKIDNHQTRDFTIGDDTSQYERDLSEYLLGMNEDETAKFIGATEVKIQLIEIVTLKEWIHKWSDEEKLAMALHHKKEGNELFAQDHIYDAAHRWVKALKILCSIPRDVGKPVVESDEIETTKAMLYNNLATYYSRVEDWTKTLSACQKVLRQCPGHVKAHYKAGLAYMKDGDFEKATSAFRSVLKVEPNNTVAKEKLKAALKAMDDRDFRYRKIVKNMFEA